MSSLTLNLRALCWVHTSIKVLSKIVYINVNVEFIVWNPREFSRLYNLHPWYWNSLLYGLISSGENSAHFLQPMPFKIFPIFVPPGTHHCWVDRGGMVYAQHLYTWITFSDLLGTGWFTICFYWCFRCYTGHGDPHLTSRCKAWYVSFFPLAIYAGTWKNFGDLNQTTPLPPFACLKWAGAPYFLMSWPCTAGSPSLRGRSGNTGQDA